MYFGIGGHPGFNIPMEEGLSFEDYELEFSRACEPQRILFSQECFVEGKESYELLEGRRIPLRHNLLMKMLLCWRKPLERFCFTVRRAKRQ